MMTDRVDGGGGAAFSARISSDNASDASDDDSLAFANLDTRKRKESSFVAPDAVDSSDQNKRTKHELSEYSGASFDPQQGTTSAEEAPELDTSFDSRCDTSAFSSGEEGFSQRPDPFTQHKPGAFKQSQNSRDDSWSGERNLLQLQLGSFIHKEKLKLESESESLHSLSSIESVPADRFSESSGSLSGYLRESSSFAESSENTGYYSSRTSSILSSVMRNKEDEVRIDAEGRASLTHLVQGISWPSEQVHKRASVHQKFVLSSGRPSNVTAAREDTRVYTIDRDFDDYFAKLML